MLSQEYCAKFERVQFSFYRLESNNFRMNICKEVKAWNISYNNPADKGKIKNIKLLVPYK